MFENKFSRNFNKHVCPAKHYVPRMYVQSMEKRTCKLNGVQGVSTMVQASNPRLMNRVVDAVLHLCEGKGSTARDILDFLRQSSKIPQRNFTMQVRRALKHAVNAGLLRHRSGRYKALFTLNPAPNKESANENGDEKSVSAKNALNTAQITTRVRADGKEGNREKHRRRHRGRRRKRSSSRKRKQRRRGGSRRRDQIAEIRKLQYKEHEERTRSPRHEISSSKLRTDIGKVSGSSSRKRRKATSRDRTCCSDFSDNSGHEGTKAKARRRSPTRQECKLDGTTKLNRRSASRNRSPQRQQSQQFQLNHANEDNENKLDSDDRNNKTAEEDIDNHHAPDNSGSGSTL